jgi:hypothetical protein
MLPCWLINISLVLERNIKCFLNIPLEGLWGVLGGQGCTWCAKKPHSFQRRSEGFNTRILFMWIVCNPGYGHWTLLYKVPPFALPILVLILWNMLYFKYTKSYDNPRGILLEIWKFQNGCKWQLRLYFSRSILSGHFSALSSIKMVNWTFALIIRDLLEAIVVLKVSNFPISTAAVSLPTSSLLRLLHDDF